MPPDLSSHTDHTAKCSMIWIVSDDKPGHLNQSLGLAEALCALDSHVRYVVLSVKDAWISLLRADARPALIISAGRQTHLINVLLARRFRAKNLVLMRPSLPSHWFDLCLIPEHDQPKTAPHIVTTVGALNRMQSAIKVPNSALILVGGPSKHFEWSSETVACAIGRVINTNPSLSFQIATSRRTPQKLVDQLSSKHKSLVVTPESVGSSWLSSTLPTTEYAWVTSDSASMVYEALSAGALVRLIHLKANSNSRVARGVLSLQAAGLVDTGAAGSSSPNSGNTSPSGPEALDSDVQATLAQPLIEARRVATLILKKGWL